MSNYKYKSDNANHTNVYQKELTFICDKCKRYVHIKLKVIKAEYVKFLIYDNICYQCYEEIISHFNVKYFKQLYAE